MRAEVARTVRSVGCDSRFLALDALVRMPRTGIPLSRWNASLTRGLGGAGSGRASKGGPVLGVAGLVRP